MNDLHRLFEDAAPEPVRGLSVDAVVTAARRRRRLRAGAAGLALALVLGGVATASVTLDGPTQTLQPAETPAPTAPPSATPDPAASAGFTVDIALFGPSGIGCGGTAPTLVQRPTDAPPTPERALRALFSAVPTPSEKAAGLFSAFPSTAADLLISVRLADGIAYVNLHDFRSLIPNASTSCGSIGFYGALQKTLAPFGVGILDPVGPLNSTVRVAIEGDPRLAAEFFQVGCEDPVQPGDPCDPGEFASTDPGESTGPLQPSADVQVALLSPNSTTCTETTLVTRSTAAPTTPADALHALFFQGPTERERAAGLGSWFSSDTADLLLSVRIEDGVAYLNLSDTLLGMNNVSTSCGTFGFFSQLNRTLEPFGVRQVLIAVEGDPDTAVNFLGIVCDDPGQPGTDCGRELFVP